MGWEGGGDVLYFCKYFTALCSGDGWVGTDWTGLDCLSWEEALMPYAIKDDIPYVTRGRHSREPETP